MDIDMGDVQYGSSAGEAAPPCTQTPAAGSSPADGRQSPRRGAATDDSQVGVVEAQADRQHQESEPPSPKSPKEGAKHRLIRASVTFESEASITSVLKARSAEASMTMDSTTAVTMSDSMPNLEPRIAPDVQEEREKKLSPQHRKRPSLQHADTAPADRLTSEAPQSRHERKKQSASQFLNAQERLIQRLDRLCEAIERNGGTLSAVASDEPRHARIQTVLHGDALCTKCGTGVKVGLPIADASPTEGAPGQEPKERAEWGMRASYSEPSHLAARLPRGMSTTSMTELDAEAAGLFCIQPCYEELPDVEVTIKVYSLSNLNAALQCFNADFAVMLDWVDPALRYRVHYFDREPGTSQGPQYIIPKFTEEAIFNPQILVDNALDNLEPMSGADPYPRIGGVLNKELHLKKTMRFRGTLSIPSNDLRMFPFDIQALRIELKSMRSSVAVRGGRHSPSLVGPSIRRITERRDSQDKGSSKRHSNMADPACESFPSPKSVVPQGCSQVPPRSSERRPSVNRITRFKAEGTVKHGHVVHEDNISLGELNLWRWGPILSRDDSRDDEYGIVLGFKRVSSQYIFDFVIQVVILLLATVALYIDSAEEEALANRASITIVLVLTLVTFSLDRPQALMNIPYSTFHDIFRRTFVLMMVALSVSVCVVPAVCKSQASHQQLPELCNCCKWCGASTFDCIIMAVTHAITFVVIVIMVVTVRHHRRVQEQMVADKIIDKLVPENSHSWETAILRANSSEKQLDRSRCQRCLQCLQVWRWCSSESARGQEASQKVVPGPHTPTSTRHEVIVPEVESSAPSLILDVGGGEAGLYRYSFDDELGPCSLGGKKAKFDLHGALDEIHKYNLNSDGLGAANRPEGRTLALHIASELRTLGFGIGTADPPVIIVGFAARQDAVEQNGSSPFETSSKLVPLAFTEAAEALVKYLEHEVNNQGVSVRLRCFTPSKPMVAGFEICAVEYLLQHADFPFRVHAGESSHKGSEQFSSWLKGHLRDGILTKCRKNGKCTVAEFVHGFIDLPLQPTHEKTAQELMYYFDSWDDGLGELPWNSLVKLIMENQRLLQAVVRERLFAGTISVSTSACHVARKNSRSHDRMLALHTLPLGNKDATRLNHFPRGQHVTRSHAEAWRRAVRVRLEEVQGMPRNLRGLFVAISAAWYAAQEAGISEQLVPAGEAVQRLNFQLCSLFDEGGQRIPPADQHRSVANLVLVSEVIEYVLSKESWLIFRREWTMPSGGIVATWCLGWYLLGESRCEDWARRRRVQR